MIFKPIGRDSNPHALISDKARLTMKPQFRCAKCYHCGRTAEPLPHSCVLSYLSQFLASTNFATYGILHYLKFSFYFNLSLPPMAIFVEFFYFFEQADIHIHYLSVLDILAYNHIVVNSKTTISQPI